ncbi:unnamed protein product [Caretta caretta]
MSGRSSKRISVRPIEAARAGPWGRSAPSGGRQLRPPPGMLGVVLLSHVSLLPHRQRKRSREEGEVCNCSLRKCNSTFSYLKHFCTDTKSLSMTCYKFLVFCFI